VCGCGVEEPAGLPECRSRALTTDVQHSVVSIVLDREKPFEVARHRLPVGSDLSQQRDGLPVVLASRPLPNGSTADRVGRGDPGKHRESRSRPRGRQLVLLRTHHLSYFQEGQRLI
jgi:hypothetical protein